LGYCLLILESAQAQIEGHGVREDGRAVVLELALRGASKNGGPLCEPSCPAATEKHSTTCWLTVLEFRSEEKVAFLMLGRIEMDTARMVL
jgi:hypothetical protein